MTLRQKQSLFTLLLTKLIRRAHRLGLEPVLDEAYRPPETAKLYARQGRGSAASLHCLKLASDLNCYRKGRFLTRSEDYKPLGRYWKKLHPLCRWGGDFLDSKGRPNPDGRHFSLEHQGRK